MKFPFYTVVHFHSKPDYDRQHEGMGSGYKYGFPKHGSHLRLLVYGGYFFQFWLYVANISEYLTLENNLITMITTDKWVKWFNRKDKTGQIFSLNIIVSSTGTYSRIISNLLLILHL